MDRDRIKELMEKGKKKLERDDIENVHLQYCPICDEEEWKLFDGRDILKEGELDCWGKDHSEYYFAQDFCSYHIDAWELNTILKYLDVKEDVVMKDKELEEKIEGLDIKQWSLAYKGNQVFADFENDVYLRLEIYSEDGTKKKWLDWIEPTSAIWDVEDDDYIETNFVPISDTEAIRDIKKRIVYDISPQYKEGRVQNEGE